MNIIINGWISADNQKPEVDKRVLIHVPGEAVATGYFDGEAWRWSESDSLVQDEDGDEDVAYWMEIPPLPS